MELIALLLAGCAVIAHLFKRTSSRSWPGLFAVTVATGFLIVTAITTDGSPWPDLLFAGIGLVGVVREVW